MSKPNLPPLPDLRGDVVNEAFWKFINSTRHTIPSYIVDDLRPAIYAALSHVLPIYAEEAVRQALAAQVPVAWMTEDGRVSTDITKRTAMPRASQEFFCIPLARIPENSDG